MLQLSFFIIVGLLAVVLLLILVVWKILLVLLVISPSFLVNCVWYGRHLFFSLQIKSHFLVISLIIMMQKQRPRWEFDQFLVVVGVLNDSAFLFGFFFHYCWTSSCWASLDSSLWRVFLVVLIISPSFLVAFNLFRTWIPYDVFN